MPRPAAVLALLGLLLPGAAWAEDLVPPAPGFSIKFRFANFETTTTVIKVDGLESRAEVLRTDQPGFTSVLRSYRVWYTREVALQHGVLFQDSPTETIDQFATLTVGTVRAFPAKLRYEPAAGTPTLPGGQPNRAFANEVTMTYAVERKETVTVPAGTFETFVLKRTQVFADANDRATRSEYTRIWYAPAIRWWVKYEYKSELPESPAGFGEAVEIKRP